MPGDFIDPTPEDQVIVLVEHEIVCKAEGFIKSCEHCNLDGAEWPFNAVLDRLTGCDPSVTDYVLEHPAKCPNCHRDVLEETFIQLA